MLDVFDYIAFTVFAVLLAVAVIIVVTLGQLPGQIAQKRGHPQAAAINVAVGVVTAGVKALQKTVSNYEGGTTTIDKVVAGFDAVTANLAQLEAAARVEDPKTQTKIAAIVASARAALAVTEAQIHGNAVRA